MSRISVRPAAMAPAPCKICDGAAALYDVVDFNKSCEELHDVRLPLSGVPIYYRRCAACGFLFTDAFDDWSIEEFKAHIYNDDYHVVDPDYQTTRPRSNADLVTGFWGEKRAELRVLDFGGGNDVLCATLRAKGFAAAVTYDPMVPEHARHPDGKFDLVTCFETFEHLPDPLASIALLLDCMAEQGLIFYSTVVVPDDIDNGRLDWWYVAPRNGHVSIFSRQALTAAWGRHGYKTVSFNQGTHLAFRTLPSYLAHLQDHADSYGRDDNAAAAPTRAADAA